MSDKRNDNNKQHPIDKVFRDGLHNRPFEFDEKYWEQAQGNLSQFDQLKKKGKKGNRGLFWMLGGAFVVIGFLAWFVFKPDAKMISQNTTNKQQQDTIIENTADGNIAELNGKHISTPISSQNEKINEINSQVIDNQTNKNQSEHQNNNLQPEKQVKIEQSTAKNGLKERSHNQEPFAEQNNVSVTTGNSFEEGNDVVENSATNQIFQSDEKDELVNNKSSNNQQSGIVPTPNPVEEIVQTATSGNGAIIVPDSIMNNQDDKVLTELVIDSNRTAAIDYTSSDSTLTPLLGTVQPKNNATLDVTWFGALSFGADFTATSLSANIPTVSDWINYRNAGESGVTTLGISLEAGLNVKQFILSTGVNTYAYSGDANYNFQSIDIDSTIEYIYDTTMVTIIDSFYVVTMDTTNQVFKGRNTLQYTEIPLLIGYQFRTGNWRIGLSTGPSIGLLNRVEVTYPDYPLTTTETLATSYFKSSYYNWIAKPSVTYMFTDHMGIGINGMFRWNLGSIVVNSDYMQKQTGYGLQFGIRVEF